MYGPTIRGGMTFRIGVPGSIRAACAGSRAEPTELLPPASATTSGPHTPVPWSRGLHVAAGQETPISGRCAQPILPWRLTIPTVKYGFHGFHYIELAPAEAHPPTAPPSPSPSAPLSLPTVPSDPRRPPDTPHPLRNADPVRMVTA